MAQPSLAKCLWFLLWSPIKVMIRFQSLLFHVSQSHQYRNPPSRFPSRSYYKERDAPYAKPSLTCLTKLSEFQIREPSLQVPLPWRQTLGIQNSLLLSPKVPGKWTPFQVPQWGPYGEGCPFPESSFHVSYTVPSTRALPQVSISDLH